MVERLLKKQNMTKYRLAVEAGIPHATLNDICSGKTRLEKCSAETSITMIFLCRQRSRNVMPQYKEWFKGLTWSR